MPGLVAVPPPYGLVVLSDRSSWKNDRLGRFFLMERGAFFGAGDDSSGVEGADSTGLEVDSLGEKAASFGAGGDGVDTSGEVGVVFCSAFEVFRTGRAFFFWGAAF